MLGVVSKETVRRIMTVPNLWATHPNDPMFNTLVAEDTKLIQQIQPFVGTNKISQDDLTLLFEFFEYHSPTGIGRKPCTDKIRKKMQILAARLSNG